MAKSRTSAALMTAADRKKQVVILRKGGLSYSEISAKVGLSRGRICKILNEVLDDFNAETIEAVSELRKIESARLDNLTTGLWSDAIKGNINAVNAVLRIMERRAKLLGLDAPAKIAPTSPDGKAEYGSGGLAALLETVTNGDQSTE